MELINSTDVQILYHRRAILSRDESATRSLSWRRWKDTIRGSLRIIVVTTSLSAHINEVVDECIGHRTPSAVCDHHVPVRILLRKTWTNWIRQSPCSKPRTRGWRTNSKRCVLLSLHCRQAEGTVTVERCLHQRDERSLRLKGRGGRSGEQGVRISVATPDKWMGLAT